MAMVLDWLHLLKRGYSYDSSMYFSAFQFIECSLCEWEFRSSGERIRWHLEVGDDAVKNPQSSQSNPQPQ